MDLCTVTVYYSHRLVPVIIENLLGCLIRVGHKVHAAFVIISHLGLVSKGIHLFHHLTPLIITAACAGSFQFYFGDISCFVVMIICDISSLVRKTCATVCIGNSTDSSVRHGLYHYPALTVILVFQINIAGKIPNFCKSPASVIFKGHPIPCRIRH